MKYFFTLLSLMLITSWSFSQEKIEWELKKEKNDLKVYVKDNPDSPFKELKMKFTIEASMSSIVSLLQDVNAIPDWVYKCPESYHLDKLNEQEEVYYNRVDFPWPMSDRDMVVRNIMTQNPETKVVRSESFSIPDYLPAKEDIIRIQELHLWWEFTPRGDGIVDVEYYLSSDPGGMLPAWVVNLAIDQGPTQTIKKFKKILQEPKYKNARLEYISELNE